LDKLGVKRLKYRASRIEQACFAADVNYKNKTNWENALFTYIAEALGFSKNKEPFLRLAEKLNPGTLKSLNLNLSQLEALFFGTAGFLKELNAQDEYSLDLLAEWESLRNKTATGVMDKSEWNFFPLRPPNFPTLRIAYLAGICIEILYNDFFRRIILCFENSKSIKDDLAKLFFGVTVSDYWLSHYNFGKTKKSSYGIIGLTRLANIIDNTLLPLILLYARRFEKKELINKISDYFLTSKDNSENEITKVMSKQLGFKLRTVSEHQGAIQLHNFFCINGKCDDCYIGTRVFTEPRVSDYLQIILY
jgi:hypothetical protein